MTSISRTMTPWFAQFDQYQSEAIGLISHRQKDLVMLQYKSAKVVIFYQPRGKHDDENQVK